MYIIALIRNENSVLLLKNKPLNHYNQANYKHDQQIVRPNRRQLPPTSIPSLNLSFYLKFMHFSFKDIS